VVGSWTAAIYGQHAFASLIAINFRHRNIRPRFSVTALRHPWPRYVFLRYADLRNFLNVIAERWFTLRADSLK
jgi:hypothetical protein